jgi:hypothetical protein
VVIGPTAVWSPSSIPSRIGTPELKPSPRSACIAAEGFEATRATPFDPDAGMARPDCPGHSVGDAKLLHQRLDARMHRFSRPVAAEPFAFAKDDAQPSRRARNRCGGACGASAYDDYVGID